MVIKFITPNITNGSLSIIQFGEEDNAAVIPTKPNQRTHYIIHFIISGEGVYTTKSATVETSTKLTAGMAFAVHKYDTVHYVSNLENPLHYCWVGFDGEDSEKILNEVGFTRANPTLTLTHPNDIKQTFGELVKAGQKAEKFAILSAFYRFLNTLKKNNVLDDKLIPEERDTVFAQAINYIKANLHRNVTLTELADYLHINPSYFAKIFKKRFNISPHAYIIRARLQQAEFLVKTTDKTISEISDMLNFSDVYSFSKQFKKVYGFSPTRCRTFYQEEQKL